MERELGSLILATDISRQNDYLSRFRTHLDQDSLCLSNSSHRHFVLQVGYIFSPAFLSPVQDLSLSADQQVLILFSFFLFFLSAPVQMALKCADICNPCRPWELSKQWSEKVTEEFFQQGACIVSAIWFYFDQTPKLFIHELFSLYCVAWFMQETLRRNTSLKWAHFVTERRTQSATSK